VDGAGFDIVTGALGYTGKYITARLLAQGRHVKTLTSHPDRPNSFGGQVDAAPFNFENPAELEKNLQGAEAIFNTYWVRFPRGEVTYERAVENSKVFIRAAERAGVRKFVHVSVSNPSEDSPLPYFRGKALVERALHESRLSYAIVRPTLVFGIGDILINNIAWFLRRLPVFMIPGDGSYRLQPVYVEDVAQLAVQAASQSENLILDAQGPDTFNFDELVRLIAQKLGSRARIVHVTPNLALLFCKFLGKWVGDVVLTRGETEGLMASLLVTDSAPTGRTRLSDWLAQNRERVGTRYACELARHYR
jgi:NADH dehydrogenase